MTNRQTVLENEHFRLERLTDGVFAAINTLRGGAMSNAGIVDLGEETLVFDAFLTRAAAIELRRAAEKLTGRPPRYLINSHAHGDHVLGNHVFLPEATVIASRGTHAALSADDSTDVDPEEMKAFLGQLETAVAEARDESTRRNAEGNLYPRKWLLEELPILPVVPTIVVRGEIEFHGSTRTVRLIPVDRAHTDGDLVLVCPDDRVVFLGDLGFFQDSPPFIAPEGSAVGWSEKLRELEALDLAMYVPGHGDIGTKVDMAAQRSFLDAVIHAVRPIATAGGTVDEAVARVRETEYARWESAMLYRTSIESALTQLASDGEEACP